MRVARTCTLEFATFCPFCVYRKCLLLLGPGSSDIMPIVPTVLILSSCFLSRLLACMLTLLLLLLVTDLFLLLIYIYTFFCIYINIYNIYIYDSAAFTLLFPGSVSGEVEKF